MTDFQKGPRKAMRLGQLQGSELPLIHRVIAYLLFPACLIFLNGTFHPITKPSAVDTTSFCYGCFIRQAVRPLPKALTHSSLSMRLNSTHSSCRLQLSINVLGMPRQVNIRIQSIDKTIANDGCLNQCDLSSCQGPFRN